MMLINSLLANATDTHWDEFTSALERLNVRKAVIVRPPPVPPCPPPTDETPLSA